MSRAQNADGGCRRSGESDRRQFLTRVITAVHAAIGGTLGVIVGGAVLSPGVAARQENWLTAGSVGDLPDNEPTPVTLRVVRQDGYTQAIPAEAGAALNSARKARVNQ